MMKRTGSVLLILMAIVASSCNQKKKDTLSSLERAALFNNPFGSLGAQFCTLDSEKAKSKLKFTFVIDKSGSNQTYNTELGTDVDGARRYLPLIDFLSSAPDDPSVYYSMVNFSTDATTVRDFTNDRASMLASVNDEANPSGSFPARPTDGGWTNYLSAIENVRQMYQRDIQREKDQAQNEIVSSYYVVFFISDGFPLVDGNAQSKSSILNAIDGVLAIKTGDPTWVDSIQMHTGYYYNVLDPAAESLLQEMATQGKGDAYKFAAGNVIDYRRFSVPQRNVRHTFRDVFVKNLNTVWWNGELVTDSDGDGLPDFIEKKMGSILDQSDSDKNGVSDYVEYLLTGKPCKDFRCTPGGAEPFTACAAYKKTDASGNPYYGDLDSDRLNDCEELLLKSKVDDWTSRGDWIPDSLGLFAGVTFAPGTTFSPFADPDSDGVTNYSEIKGNTPLLYANSRVYGIQPFKYQLDLMSSDTSHDCYQLKIDQIALSGPSDKLRIYLMESSSVIDTKKFLRIVERNFSNGRIDLSRSDF